MKNSKPKKSAAPTKSTTPTGSSLPLRAPAQPRTWAEIISPPVAPAASTQAASTQAACPPAAKAGSGSKVSNWATIAASSSKSPAAVPSTHAPSTHVPAKTIVAPIPGVIRLPYAVPAVPPGPCRDGARCRRARYTPAGSAAPAC